MSKKFAIIGWGRTGSNYLADLLRSSDDIYCANELFHSKAIYNHNVDEYDFEKLIKRDNDSIRFLNEFYSQYSLDYKWVGFKFFFYQDPIILNYLIDNPDIKLIFITRNNKLAQFSSFEFAKMTDNWISESTDKYTLKNIYRKLKLFFGTTNKICFNYEHYRNFSNARIMEEDFFKQICDLKKRDYVQVEYTQLFNGDYMLSQFHDWFGIDNFNLKSKFKKQNPNRIVDRFKNKSDIEKYFKFLNKEEWLNNELSIK